MSLTGPFRIRPRALEYRAGYRVCSIRPTSCGDKQQGGGRRCQRCRTRTSLAHAGDETRVVDEEVYSETHRSPTRNTPQGRALSWHGREGISYPLLSASGVQALSSMSASGRKQTLSPARKFEESRRRRQGSRIRQVRGGPGRGAFGALPPSLRGRRRRGRSSGRRRRVR
jgi:hypothetical protein